MIKLLILNSPIEIGDEIKDYFKSLDISVTYKVLEGIFPTRIAYVFRNGNQCVTPDVLQPVREMIDALQYNYVIFLYKGSDYPKTLNTGGYTELMSVYPGTNLATVRIDGHELDYAIHEMHHLFCNRLQFLKYPVKDYMDSTPVGKPPVWMDYWKNFFGRSDPDSNHSQTWNQIYPYRAYLNSFPPLMKRGMKNHWVSEWQYVLNRNNYWYVGTDGSFGPLTEKATRDFQKKLGVISDGIVGKITLTKALNDLWKKKL